MKRNFILQNDNGLYVALDGKEGLEFTKLSFKATVFTEVGIEILREKKLLPIEEYGAIRIIEVV